MEGIDREVLLDKIKIWFSKYILYVLIALIVIVIIILIIPNRTTREQAIYLTEKYIKSNNIVLTNVEREFSFETIGMKLDDSCYEGGIVLASTSGYKVLYVCENDTSEDLLKMVAENQLILNGTNPFYVRYGNAYEEPGYYIKDDNAIVKQTGKVINTPGMYLINYEVIGTGTYLKSTRVVFITNKSFVSYPTIKLRGQERIVLVKGESYIEPGYDAYDSKDGVMTSAVITTGTVNTNKIGKYVIRYQVTNSIGNKTEMYRHVNVVNDTSDADFEITAEPLEYTNTDVNIKVEVTGTGFDFILGPDNDISTSTETSYKATENGTYVFYMKKKDGSIIEKSIEISNIDKVKPTGSCKSVVTDNKTVVTVSASDKSGIKKYNYVIGSSGGESVSNTYTVNSAIKTASVTIYDNADNYQIISCVVVDNTTKPSSITPSEPSSPTEELTPSTVSHFQRLTYNGMNYVVYYPDNLDLSQKNPLVIFLHGDGERGTSVTRLDGLVFIKNMKSGKFKHAVYLVPQRADGSYWNPYMGTLKSLINMIISTYNIDTSRVSITGHSSGAIGVYTIVGQNPNMFSAAVVVAGRNKDGNVKNLTSTPIRHYHGTNDRNVDYNKGQSSAAEIKNAGGNIEFIPLQGKGHAITDYVYNHTDAIEWMLRQSR